MMNKSLFVLWSIFCLTTIAVVSLTWWDPAAVTLSALNLVAAVTGMAYTLLAGRGRILCYAFGLINAPLYVYLSYRYRYYGDMALNAYYFVMMIPGLYCWRRHQAEDPAEGVIRTRLSARERVVYLAAGAAATAALWAALKWWGGNRPLCDALTNVLSVAAMVLTVKRCREQWLLWIVVDAIEVFMWWKVGETSMALLAMWLLFLLNGLFFFWSWRNSS